MGQFVLRRKAWYRAMTDLNGELKLPDLILSEQLLNNAGLTADQKLMIRTTLQGDMTFDKVAAELINQHPRIHERAQGHPGLHGRRFGGQRGNPGTYRAHAGQKGKGFQYPGKPRFPGYSAEAEDPYNSQHGYEDTCDEYAETEYQDENPVSYLGYEDEGTAVDYDIGTFAEAHLAYLAEGGLDLEDAEACEYASEVIQAHKEAYFAGKAARSKGHTGFQKPQFELSGSFSLDDKRAKLQALKARTTCRRCGAIGHWSGDAICPLQKGKGKKSSGKSATASTSTTSTTSPLGKGKTPKGQKPRMVPCMFGPTT